MYLRGEQCWWTWKWQQFQEQKYAMPCLHYQCLIWVSTEVLNFIYIFSRLGNAAVLRISTADFSQAYVDCQPTHVRLWLVNQNILHVPVTWRSASMRHFVCTVSLPVIVLHGKLVLHWHEFCASVCCTTFKLMWFHYLISCRILVELRSKSAILHILALMIVSKGTRWICTVCKMFVGPWLIQWAAFI